MRTIKKTLLVFFAVITVFAVLSPGVSADTDVDVSVSTTENLTVSMYADAGGDIDFWIQGYNVEERFESLEECCDYLLEKTDINAENIEEMRSYFNGHMSELYGRTEWLKDKVESNKDKINDVEGMLISRTSFLKSRQDYIMETQDHIKSDIRDIRDTQDEIKHRQRLQSHHMANLEASFHDRLCALRQKLNDFINYEHFEFFMFMIPLVAVTGYLALFPKKKKKVSKEKFDETVSNLKAENKELREELNSVRNNIETGDEN